MKELSTSTSSSGLPRDPYRAAQFPKYELVVRLICSTSSFVKNKIHHGNYGIGWDIPVPKTTLAAPPPPPPPPRHPRRYVENLLSPEIFNIPAVSTFARPIPVSGGGSPPQVKGEMAAHDNQSNATSSVVKAEILASAKCISDSNGENAQLCGKDDLYPEERKKIKKKEKIRSDSAVSSVCETSPHKMEEGGIADVVARKTKKKKQRLKEQEDAKVSDGDFLSKEDDIKEKATETSEANPTHSKKKKKEKHHGEDEESQLTRNGDAKVPESNVVPVLQSTGGTNDIMDLSFSKRKKKKRKHGSEEDQAPEVAVLGIDGVKGSVDLTSTRASNLAAEEGDTTGERNVVLSTKKMKKVKHCNEEAESQGLRSGDSISADGEAAHTKKKKKKEKNRSVEMKDENSNKGDNGHTKDLDKAEQADALANDTRSRPSKKRKIDNNCSKGMDEGYSREGDGICPVEGPDCSNQDAKPTEVKSGQSKKRKKERSCSEETDDKHRMEEGAGINPIKATECHDHVAGLDVTQANDEMEFSRPKKKKKEKHHKDLADAQLQTGEDGNMTEKDGSSTAHSPDFVQINRNEYCTETDTPAEGSFREKDGRHGVKKNKKKHGDDRKTVEGRESGNVVDECHAKETNHADNLAPLDKMKREKNKSKGTEKQQECAEKSNPEKAQGTDSQAVELVMDNTERCGDCSVGSSTQLSGEMNLVPSKKKKDEKRRRKEKEDPPNPVEDVDMGCSLTDPSFRGDHTEHVDWQDQFTHHSRESKGGSRRRISHKRQDCWLRFPKESSAKEELFHSYLVKDSSSDPHESGTAAKHILKVEQKKQVDGISTSSVLFTTAGASVSKEIIPNVDSFSIRAVGHSRKKLLILDVNGILVDIVPGVKGKYKPDFVLSRKPVFKRPFVNDFLQFCFENFSVGFWSSRIRKNLNQIVNFLLGGMKRKLLFCWDQSHCTKTGFQTVENHDKPLVLKELRKLWEKLDTNLPWSKGDYNESNTLLLDDSPYKALLNPANTGIFPYPYQYKNVEDNSLGPGGDLRLYLERLAKADDVQSFVRDNPFGQKAITESSTSWKFYERVIGQLPKGENLPRDTHHARSRSCSPRRVYPHHDDRFNPPPPRECILPREATQSQKQPQPQLHLQPQFQPQPLFHPQLQLHLHPQFQPQPQFQPPPQPQFQLYTHHQHPNDTGYSHSRTDYFPYDDRFSRPSAMEYPLGEITQPVLSQHNQDVWHYPPPVSEYSRHDVQFGHPPPSEYQLSETKQPYRDTRNYTSRSRGPHRDSRHYQPPWRENRHWDDGYRDDRRYFSNGRSGYGSRSRWH
ncbi:hypothetical protein MLD38_031875 [Melastoma candidum]|uniref:Uncharacterized protein n=1 Tax=Melastoma candidum TaxID=119954 RepID=A0ACB9MQM0_9MYRT|nr:hypothetical protein MLD38_031875 [Melastoma candidum]